MLFVSEPPTPTSPSRLQRQPTICLRGHLSKQSSQEEPARVTFENEEEDTANGGGKYVYNLAWSLFRQTKESKQAVQKKIAFF